ncbi:MAG: DUF2325 domain-containing protein [Pseudomonadota bacterium]
MKVGLKLKPGAEDYAVHGFLVKKTTEDTPFARAFHKLLDSRHQGPLRKVLRTTNSSELLAMWAVFRDNGSISGGYWAIMTCAHVPIVVKEHVFGEVHMLSHLSGAGFAKKLVEAEQLQVALDEAEERLKRNERSAANSINQRDLEIEDLRRELKRLSADERAVPPMQIKSKSVGKLEARLEKLERALICARTRARDAESQARKLTQANARKSNIRSNVSPIRTTASSKRAADQENVGPRTGLKILYVGGRTAQIPHLKQIAEQQDAVLVHHDGGKEESVQRLDSILPSVDCVMCPTDCISHAACLRAKHSCAKHNIQFFPLRNSSQSAFRSAIKGFIKI